MIELKKIFFLCPKDIYDQIAIKTNGFKDIDRILCKMIEANLLSDVKDVGH